MKTTSLLIALVLLASGGGALAAEEMAKDGCKMMAKKEPAPEPACCCQKMMTAKTEELAKTPDINALVDKMKTAKGDEALDAFAAVLNKILAERKAAQEKAPEASASAPVPAEHHH